MKVINRKEFLKLPAGTAYAKGKQWYFEALCFKGETIFHGDDWYEKDICWIETESSTEATDILQAMLASGLSQPMQDSECRDGCFEDDDIFMIFELNDLVKIKGFIETAVDLVKS